MRSDAELIAEVSSLSREDASRYDAKTEARLELVAFEISEAEPQVQDEAVRAIVEALALKRARRAGDMLAWLLVYKVVDPLQVLQAIVFCGDQSLLKICGTGRFADDVIDHLQLQKQPGTDQNFVKRTDATSGNRAPLFFDMLKLDSDSSVQAEPRPGPRSYDIDTGVGDVHNAHKAGSSQDEQLRADGYESQLRRVLKSSMSPEEAAHKISGIFKKNSEDLVVRGIFRVCLQGKTYDRLYGAVCGRLWRSSPSSWSTAWLKYLGEFVATGCEQIEAEPLKIAGQFFAHILALNVISWSETFGGLDFGLNGSTPSNRIFFVAFLQALGQQVGIKEVQERVLSPEMRTFTRGVLETDLAPGFWEIAGFTDLAEVARSR